MEARAITLIMLLMASSAMGATLMEEMTRLGATTLVDLLKQTGLDKDVEAGYFTIFAPSNQAFSNLPDNVTEMLAQNDTILRSVLSFHATKGIFRSQDAVNNMLLKSEFLETKIRVNVYGKGDNSPLFITLNGAGVLTANVQTSNGILHIIDSVMFPPAGSFYDVLSTSDQFSTVKRIVDENNMKSTLDTAMGTFLIPVNQAFDAIFAMNLSLSSNAQKEITSYHILNSVLYSAAVSNGTYSSTDHGEAVYATVAADGTIKFNQAKVVYPNIPTTNGVMHVIDSLLVPEPYASAIIKG